MKSNRRVTQHRQQRDTNNQEIGELRREVERLTRQVARLRRENDRLQGFTTEDEEAAPPAKPAAKATCPKCGSTNLGQLGLPNGKRVTACKACREWKSRPV